jgi:uncharacterized protein GlcG (DUF336 family)
VKSRVALEVDDVQAALEAARAESVKNGRTAFLSVSELTTLEGAVPIAVGGHCVGAVGVSGVKPEQDVQIATAGMKAILARA